MDVYKVTHHGAVYRSTAWEILAIPGNKLSDIGWLP